MNTVTWVRGYSNPYYFSFYLDGTIVTKTFFGNDLLFEKTLRKNRLASIVNLVYEFKKIDSKIIDARKNVHQYIEYKNRIDSYLTWINNDMSSLTDEKIKNGGLLALKYMIPILDIINDNQELKKDLFGIVNCILETSKITNEL